MLKSKRFIEYFMQIWTWSAIRVIIRKVLSEGFQISKSGKGFWNMNFDVWRTKNFQFFFKFSFFLSRLWSRGRVSVQDLYGSHTVFVSAQPTRVGRDSNIPDPEFESLIFSSGSCRHNTVWEPYRSCTDTLTLDHNRDEKEKNRKKVDGVV